jgi:hypothetical protein
MNDTMPPPTPAPGPALGHVNVDNNGSFTPLGHSSQLPMSISISMPNQPNGIPYGYVPGQLQLTAHGSSSTLSGGGGQQQQQQILVATTTVGSNKMYAYSAMGSKDREKDRDDHSVSTTGTGLGYVSYEDRSGRSDADDISLGSDRSSRLSAMHRGSSHSRVQQNQQQLQQLQLQQLQLNPLIPNQQSHLLQQQQQLRRRQPDRRPHRQRRYSSTRGVQPGQSQWDASSETGSASASVSCSSRSRTHSYAHAASSIHYHGATMSQAASQGNLPLCVLLWGMATAKRVNLLEPDEQGNTPFHYAALADLPEARNRRDTCVLLAIVYSFIGLGVI